MSYDYLTMIAPAALIDNIRTLASVFPNSGGDQFLPIAMSASGNPPTTHYGQEGFIGSEFSIHLPLTTVDTETGEVTQSAINPSPIVAMAVEAGFEITEAQLVTILSTCMVSKEPIYQTMDRLGLKIITLE